MDCGYSLEPPRRGGSNEYPQSMFLSRNKKNNVYPCKPQFYYIKVGFKGVKILQACYRDAVLIILTTYSGIEVVASFAALVTYVCIITVSGGNIITSLTPVTKLTT